jgi:cytochrome c6
MQAIALGRMSLIDANPTARPAAFHRWKRGLTRLLLTRLVLTVVLALSWLGCPTMVRAEDSAEIGGQLFQNHCAGCHVHGGNIIRRNKTLKLAALTRAGLTSPEAIAAVAAAGIGQMGGYGAVLGADGPAAVGAWVWDQAQRGWP